MLCITKLFEAEKIPSSFMSDNDIKNLGVGVDATKSLLTRGIGAAGKYLADNPKTAGAVGLGAGLMYLANRNKNRQFQQ